MVDKNTPLSWTGVTYASIIGGYNRTAPDLCPGASFSQLLCFMRRTSVISVLRHLSAVALFFASAVARGVYGGDIISIPRAPLRASPYKSDRVV